MSLDLCFCYLKCLSTRSVQTVLLVFGGDAWNAICSDDETPEESKSESEADYVVSTFDEN